MESFSTPLSIEATKAVASTVYLAVAAACVSLPFAMSMEWKSVKPNAVSEEDGKDDAATPEKNA